MRALGDIVDVDLGTGDATWRPVDEAVLGRVLLGRGLNSLTLLEEVGPNVEPLDAANPLLFTCGLLTGTQAPSAARVQVSARSPHTGLLGSSSVGGTVGPALRANGIHSLQVRGRAEAPVYLYVAAGRVEVRDASRLWGLDVEQTVAALREELEGLRAGGAGASPGAAVSAAAAAPGVPVNPAGEKNGRVSSPHAMFVIGPAGEHELPLACIVTQRGHAAGRTGMGAVMGSKNVKAVVVRTAKGREQADQQARAAVKRYLAKIKAAPNYADKAAHGTSSAVNVVNEMGMLGTFNYRRPRFEQAAAIDGTSMDRYVERLRACRGCPVHCKAELRVDSGPYAGLTGERPDFEPIVSWGSKTGLADPEAVIYLHHLCDLFGIDSVSAGNAVAFAMQLWDEGILSVEDTDGLELRWGDVAAMETILRQMAAGEGFGALLGRGVREAARVIGHGAEKYAYHVKGLELTAFDPRGASAAGLGYAVSNRGGDFTSVYARHEFSLTPAQALELYGDELAADRRSPVGKAAMVKRSMAICAVLDSIGLCKIPALTLVNEFDLSSEADLVSAVAGITVTPGQLFEIGERILVIERLFNMRFGASAADDVLPEIFMTEPLPEGPAAGRTIDLPKMLDEFYAVMGWTSEGVPTKEGLRRLGLEEFAPDEAPI